VRRVVAVVALVVTLSLVASPRASAVTINDPWVPPSVATHDGLASSALAVSGASVPLEAADPADVLTTAAVAGTSCTRRYVSWGWAGSNLVVSGAIAGTTTCNLKAYPNEWPVFGLTFGCVVTNSYFDSVSQRTRLVGEVYPYTAGAGDTYAISGSQGGPVVFAPNCAGIVGAGAAANVTLAWVKLASYFNTTTASDGLLAFRPGVLAAYPPVVTVVVHCSDNSTVSTSFGGGLSVRLPECVTGVFVSAEVLAGGQVVGNVGVAPAFQGHSCLSSAGACVLWVTWAGGSCANDDPSCAWWGTTSPADSCDWKNGAGQMWSLPPADCVAARHDGFDVPGVQSQVPSATATHDPLPEPTIIVNVPQPTVIVNVPQPTVNVSVTVNVEPLQPANNPAGGCLAEMTVWNPASWVLEPLRCALVPSDAFLAGLLPDNQGGPGPWTDSCPGRPANGYDPCSVARTSKAGDWKRALEAAGEAFVVPPPSSEDCMGPGIPLGPPSNTTIYLASSCEAPGKTFAAIMYVGSEVIIYVVAFLATTRMITSAVGASAFAGGAVDAAGRH
jgi:hypothetical protein